MSKVFVTGAAGFMGYALVSRFESEMEVFGTIRGVEQRAAIDGTNWSAIVHDWELPYQPLSLFEADVFIHAAFKGPDTDLLAHNEQMAVNAVEAARRLSAKKIVILSSGSVYSGQQGPITESTPPIRLNQANTYSHSLQRIEQAFTSAFPNIPVLVIRLFYPYGPTQARNRLIPRLAGLIGEGKPIFLCQNLTGGFIGPRICPLYIDDAVEIIFRLVTQAALPVGASIVNLGGVETLSIRKIGMMIGEALGKECLFSEDVQSAPTSDFYSSMDFAVKLSGFTPKIYFREGLQATLELSIYSNQQRSGLSKLDR